MCFDTEEEENVFMRHDSDENETAESEHMCVDEFN